MCEGSPLSVVPLCASPWTIARQAPLSVGLPRQEHWSGVPLPSPGIEPMSPAEAHVCAKDKTNRKTDEKIQARILKES